MKRQISLKKIILCIIFIIVLIALFIQLYTCVLENCKKEEKIYGVWIASSLNKDYPIVKGLSSKELRSELDDIVNTVQQLGFNTIFFQVRPSSDALYESNIFPWSDTISGVQGVAPDENFDPLEYIINIAHLNNIKVHAWINPLRVTNISGTSLNNLDLKNPARLHPEYCVKYVDEKLYYNPGMPEVRKLVCAGVEEIVRKYDVDGIHIDDYFYPYSFSDDEFDDSKEYKMYGNNLSITQWRINNINQMVKEIYYTVKHARASCLFGISPYGIYEDALNWYYCDPIAWINEGYIDYLIPQIYFQCDESDKSFQEVAIWWNDRLNNAKVDLYIGHSLSKYITFDDNEIEKQLEFSRKLNNYKGSVFFDYRVLKENVEAIKNEIENSLLID